MRSSYIWTEECLQRNRAADQQTAVSELLHLLKTQEDHSLIDLGHKAQQQAEQLARHHSPLQETASLIQSAVIQLEEGYHNLVDYQRTLETTPERLAAAERRPSLASARPARAARDAFPSVVAHKRDPRAFAEPFPSSSPSTSEDSPSPPRARALKNETDEPKKKAVDPTRRVISVTERTTVTTRRYGAAAGVTNASEARQRMIAERTRRILDDE